MRRILFATHSCYLDDSNGAAVASRALMKALARRGFAVEVLCGAMLDLRHEVDLGRWLADRGSAVRTHGEVGWVLDPLGIRADAPPHFRLTADGVPITVHRGPTTRPHHPDDAECAEFLGLLTATLDRFRPDVLIGYGGGTIAGESFRLARARGLATVFPLHNFLYNHAGPFADVDRVLVASRYSAEYHREALGLDCDVLPYLIDHDRVRVEKLDPRFVTYVNPSPEKGVFAFARIADELGRRRPDIPLLVVEGRGDERTLAGCGLDLRAWGTVSLMSHTTDPREFWRVTRICLLPSLWRENQPMVAVEAMLNGIPVLGSDRGGIPETLGASGILLPLPEWMTPATRELPTAEDVAPWVEAVIRLWDDPAFHAAHRRRALAEARRWDPEVIEPRYAGFFEGLRPGASRQTSTTPITAIVPHRA